MTEFEIFVKSLAKGLQTIAENASLLADKLNDLADVQGPVTAETDTKTAEPAETDEKTASGPKEEAEPKASAETKEKPKAGASPAKAAGKKKKTKGRISDTDKVLNIISEAESGIGIDELSRKTGFAKTKLYGIVYRLRKGEKIVTPANGIYKKP